jgi:hypothetical protein
MAKTATEARIGVTGSLYKAPVGTAMPTDVTTALGVAWVELGYTETGPKMSVDTSKESFIPWQSLSPVREVITEQTVSAAFALWQRNATTLKLAWGGGTVTGTTTRVFTPPASPSVNEGAFVFEIVDGAIIDRYCIARASIALAGDVEFLKDKITQYELELTYLQPATGSAWTLLSNDPAIVAD